MSLNITSLENSTDGNSTDFDTFDKSSVEYYWYNYYDYSNYFSSMDKYIALFCISGFGVVANAAALLMFLKFPDFTRKDPLVINQTFLDLTSSAALILVYAVYIRYVSSQVHDVILNAYDLLNFLIFNLAVLLVY